MHELFVKPLFQPFYQLADTITFTTFVSLCSLLNATETMLFFSFKKDVDRANIAGISTKL